MWFILIIIGGIVLLVGGSIMAYYLFTREGRNRRRFNRLPVTPIAHFHDGLPGKIVGRANSIDGACIVAPLSGRECVFWRVQVSEPSGIDRNTWHTLFLGSCDHQYLTITDETGTCRIPLKETAYILVDEQSFLPNLKNDDTERFRAFCRDRGIDLGYGFGIPGIKRLKFYEWIIAAGDVTAGIGIPAMREGQCVMTATDVFGVCFTNDRRLFGKGARHERFEQTG
ncbi:hypothetical protein JXA80_04080 [bacterium]|nr:hypothetical protein [candidate division CSSED10-310 bacterium]